MDWITPVTNRSGNSAMMTYDDMNRITGNCRWLYDECARKGITVSGDPTSKTTWTRNDIITLDDWHELLTCLDNLCAAVGYVRRELFRDNVNYVIVNNIERVELKIYTRLEAGDIRPKNNHFIGDRYGSEYRHAGDDFNAGGLY